MTENNLRRASFAILGELPLLQEAATELKLMGSKTMLANSIACLALIMVMTDETPVLNRCECFDLHRRIVPFAESCAWQHSIVTGRKVLVSRDEDHSDTLVALQHPSVYTLGTDSTEDYLHFNVKDAPSEVHRIDCGGEVMYHGPGPVCISYIFFLVFHIQKCRSQLCDCIMVICFFGG